MKGRIITILAISSLLTNPLKANETLATSKGCLACHSVNAKIVGPAYKDVAKRYNQKDLEKLTNKVLKGGSGSWGAIAMPPNTISKADAQKLVKWILSLKK